MAVAHRVAKWLGVLGLGGVLLATAGPAAAAEAVLHRGHGAAWESLDPQINTGARDAMILTDLYEGLVAVAADGTPIPGAAERWEVSDDGTVYTFHLRPGLRWSNGDPLTAHDFVAGMIRMIDPEAASNKAYYLTTNLRVKNAAAFNGGELKDASQVGMKALDDSTLELTLDLPSPHALDLLNSYETAPLHKASLEQHGADFVKAGNMVSNGPFMLKELVPQSHLVLVPNPNYWDAASVKLDEVWYHVTEDVNTELKRYLAGELDVTSDIPPDQIEKLGQELPAGEVHIASASETYYFSFNITRPPLDDIKLRKALSMVIDREALQQKILKSGLPPSYSYVPPVDPSYPGPSVAEKGMSMEERVAMAKQLYAEAGFGPDNPLKVKVVSSSDESEKKEAVAISIMWKSALGVQSELVNQEYQAWLDTFYAGDWDVFNDNLVGDYAGAETFLAYMRPSAEPGYNWQSQAYEDLMEKAVHTADNDARNRLLADAEKVLLDDYLIAPISGSSSRHLVRSRVEGWVDNPVEYHPSRFITLEE